ncbi:trace amine-associated receptor 8c-like [Nematostella vectensis]|uniref:trace amine-associated receptor 8c-like n=1 Tax=Nematostella vectensis TaxID=45351 RepID=UPI00207753FF|nr:trace amine-associated receptor 8c-like [Nematostella vectensis]
MNTTIIVKGPCPKLYKDSLQLLYGNTERLYPAYTILLVLAFISSLQALLGNSLVFCTIMTSKILRSPSYLFLASLSLNDFIIGAVIPFFARGRILEAQDRFDEGCRWHNGLSPLIYAICGGSLFNLVVIATDRRLAIVLRSEYRTMVTTRKARVIIATVWTGVFLYGVLSYSTSHSPAIVNTISWVATLILVAIISASYRSAFKHLRTVSASNNATNTVDIESVKYRRTLTTMVTVVACLVCSFIPILLVAIVAWFLGFQSDILMAYHFCVLVVYSSSSMNPMIYLSRMGDLRKESIRLIKTIGNCLRCIG